MSKRNDKAKGRGEGRCCGECAWFYAEDTHGYGCCPFLFAEVKECGNECAAQEHFVSRRQMRHYMAVLIQANRYRRGGHVPSWHRMPLPSDLGKAMDFACKYMKTFSNL